MNENVAGSPSASVAVSVYVAAARSSVGVPLIVPPLVVSAGAVYVSPAGKSGGPV